MQIMMIEDDKTISFAVKTFLERYGMQTTVFHNFKDTEDIYFKDFDLLILDICLPDGSGFDYLKWVRETSQIPVILLTVKEEDRYVLQGFSQGADEYISKPFSLPVLKARIDNILKRKQTGGQGLSFKDLHLDPTSGLVDLKGERIDLNKQEFSVLELLLENPDRPLFRDRLLDSVWGYDLYEVNDNTLTVTIKRLRKKLGPYGERIKTIRGKGYMWETTDERK